MREPGAAALWGKRTGDIVRALVVACAIALLAPMAAMAASAPPTPLIPGMTATLSSQQVAGVDPSVLAQAQANPDATENVIIEGVNGQATKAIATFVNYAMTERGERVAAGDRRVRAAGAARGRAGSDDRGRR